MRIPSPSFRPFGRRSLIVHAGLHKTGSTAIQAALAAAAPALAQGGWLVPRCGRPPGLDGHHNLAWQLSGDSRFDPAHGTLADLAASLAAHPGPALISSEDFETLLAPPGLPDRLAPLRAAAAGRALRILLYLRDQAGYAESLFLEMQMHGMRHAATRFLDQILAAGSLRERGWHFQFDFAALPGPGRLLRPYPQAGSSVEDFWRVLGLPGDPPPISRANPRANPRASARVSLAAHLSNRAAPGAAVTADALAELFAPGWPGRPLGLGPARRSAFARRFGPGNRAVAQAAGFDPASLTIALPAIAPLDLELLFSPLVGALIATWHTGARSTVATRAALGCAGIPV